MVRQVSQRRIATSDIGLIQDAQFLEEDAKGCAIKHQMMNGQEKDELLFRQAVQFYTKQGTFRQIEGPADLLGREPLEHAGLVRH